MTAASPAWFDDHCHLTGLDGEVADHVAAAAEHGVTRLLTVGTDVADSARAAAIAERFDGVWATAGVHPHEARHGLDGIEALLAHPSVVAVGECGLDYYYDHSPRDTQRSVFEAQIDLALRHDLALVIHTRDAWDDTFAVLDSVGVPDRTVFHCFTGGPAQAEACLERGGHLSFSGILTFPSAGDIRDAAAICPPDRALLETDSPYLTPVPHRGRPNRPAFVPLVGARLAEVWGTEVAEVARRTWDNGARVYRLPVDGRSTAAASPSSGSGGGAG